MLFNPGIALITCSNLMVSALNWNLSLLSDKLTGPKAVNISSTGLEMVVGRIDPALLVNQFANCSVGNLSALKLKLASFQVPGVPLAVTSGLVIVTLGLVIGKSKPLKDRLLMPGIFSKTSAKSKTPW